MLSTPTLNNIPLLTIITEKDKIINN